ncbi:MAG: nucleotide disphospho-sugar-binding domain-containing protein [Planctomycetota bacterium]
MGKFRNRLLDIPVSIGESPSRKRILFIGEAVSMSHVARPVVLAKWAKEAGYAVVFACGKSYCHVAMAEGFQPEDITTIPSELFYKRLFRGQFFYTKAELETYVEAERSLISRIKPDLVVGDFRLTLELSTHLTGIPYLNLMNAHWSPGRKRRLPPPRGGIFGLMPPMVRNTLFRMIEPIAFKQFGKPLDCVRRQYGLPELGDFRRHYTAGTWCGYMDLPSLVEVASLPKNHSYIGPVIWKPFGMPFPSDTTEKSNSRRKHAYVSMGTSGDNGLLPAILKALTAHDFSIVLSGISLSEEAGLRTEVKGLSGRCIAAPFFDPDEILQSATLTVCHGGSGTVYQSLKAGVPVLAIPANPDQTLVSESVEEKGCGILLDSSRANVQRISEAISELTTGNRYQKGARALSEAIQRWDTQSVWLGLLHRVFPHADRSAEKLAAKRARASERTRIR